MSQTYKAIGINLKAIPLGESDRLLTILTPDVGLIRAVAPGSRKHQSRLGGRSDLFVINECLVVKGKRLDKLIQAETVRTFPGLSQHLGRLTASQYLAEVVLLMALSDCPQSELFQVFVEHLGRLETAAPSALLAGLCHGLYHLLALAGVAPEVHQCTRSRRSIVPDLLDPTWRVEFSAEAGGLVQTVNDKFLTPGQRHPNRPTLLTATDVALLQQLSKPEILSTGVTGPETAGSIKNQQLWSRVERLLREYTQDYFERPIRSASLVDVCFATV
ncbi:DNA repair protein RecO [Nodosilinea sp. LEGE 07088]|uniref:DNA repair protein RecO n=1 Tax=Nodosilinea sp. LEGE 07088 TaxID=2777968 RepID=UPI00187E1CE6|nr:DNA repair protein RecO [Nodosilinea sp. LEGE 07088]MBE9141317.1 DNA repair protein RecO [Nodosilinea sp. LEGE 07088]